MNALKKEKFSIKTYYINKFKKIYLPLVIVVFATIIIFKIFPFKNWMNLKPETNSVILGYNNLWQLSANSDYFTKNINSPFIHFWYISILMQFELIFPIGFLILRKIERMTKKNISIIVVLLLAICSTVFFIVMSFRKDIMAVYYNTFARCFSIFYGMLLALVHYKYNFYISKRLKKLKKVIYLLYNIALIILCIYVSSESKYYAIYMIIATIVSARIIEYSMIKNGKREKKNLFIEALAKKTYGIYLIQYPVIFFLQNITEHDFVRIPLIIIITFLSACTLNMLINKIKHRKAKILCLIIIVIGGLLLITQKDFSNEMKELENLLNENQEISNEQNNEFINEEEIQETIEVSAPIENKNETPAQKQSSENDVSAQKQSTQNENKETESESQSEMTISAEGSENKNEKVAEKVKQLQVVGVGDSVLLGASKELHKRFPNGYFDGKVSRSIVGGKEVLQDLKNKKKLSNTLILALANNGDYIEKRNKDFMEFIGDREVFWVNAVGADDPKFNKKFEEFAKDYSNIHIVKWDEVAKGHSEYFYADGIHLKESGVKAYVDTI